MNDTNIDALAAPAPPGHDEHHSRVPVHAPPRAGVGLAILAVLLVLALGALYLVRHAANQREAAALAGELKASHGRLVTVDVVHVQTASADRTLTLPGEARPYRDSAVYARTSGYLDKYLVDIGDRVKEGQVLAEIETPELNDQIAAGKAKILQLKAGMHVAETQAAFAKSSYARWEAAAPDGAVSVQERDQKKSELDVAVAKVEAAKAEVTLTEAELARLNTMDQFKHVVAPYAGTITERKIDVGDLVTAGSTSASQLLFRIAQSDQLRILVDVPQSVAADVKVGMPATVSFAGRQFPGKVERTADAINDASRTLRTEVLVDNKRHELLPGTYLQVTFQFSRTRPLLQVPSSALVWRSAGPAVALVDDEGQVSFRDIKIVSDAGDLVDVDGLSGGERIALNLGSQAAEGDYVHYEDPESQHPAGVTPKGSVAEAPNRH